MCWDWVVLSVPDTQGSIPSSQKPGMGTLGRWRQEDQDFTVILCYIMGSRLAWAIGDPVSKRENPAHSPIIPATRLPQVRLPAADAVASP